MEGGIHMTRNLHTGISGRRRPKKNGLDRVKHAADVLAFLKGREGNTATATKPATKKASAAKKPAAKKATATKTTTAKKTTAAKKTTTTKKAEDK